MSSEYDRVPYPTMCCNSVYREYVEVEDFDEEVEECARHLYAHKHTHGFGFYCVQYFICSALLSYLDHIS